MARGPLFPPLIGLRVLIPCRGFRDVVKVLIRGYVTIMLRFPYVPRVAGIRFKFPETVNPAVPSEIIRWRYGGSIEHGPTCVISGHDDDTSTISIVLALAKDRVPIQGLRKRMVRACRQGEEVYPLFQPIHVDGIHYPSHSGVLSIRSVFKFIMVPFHPFCDRAEERILVKKSVIEADLTPIVGRQLIIQTQKTKGHMYVSHAWRAVNGDARLRRLMQEWVEGYSFHDSRVGRVVCGGRLGDAVHGMKALVSGWNIGFQCGGAAHYKYLCARTAIRMFCVC